MLKGIKTFKLRHLSPVKLGLGLLFLWTLPVFSKELVGPAPPRVKPPEVFKIISLVPNKTGELRAIPLFIAVPDSLCFLDFEKFAGMEDSAALDFMNKAPAWCGFRESREISLKFLVLCRLIYLGKYYNAAKAVPFFRKLKLSEPFEYCLRINQSVLKFVLAEPELARKELENTLKRFPWKVAGWKNLFSINIAMEEYEKADMLVEDVMDSLPQSLWAQKYKVNLIQMLGTESDLAQFLRKKSSWRDSLFAIQIAYGKFLKDKGESEMAIKYYSRGLEGNPENGEGWLELAELFFKKGMRELTVQCLENAIKAGIHEPKYFEILSGILRDRIFDSHQLLRQKRIEQENCIRSWRPGECHLRYEEFIQGLRDLQFESLTKFTEQAFIQGTQSRNLTQCLYLLYGSMGRTKAAGNLKSQFYFHFEYPFPFYLPFGWAVKHIKLNHELDYNDTALGRAFMLRFNDFPG